MSAQQQVQNLLDFLDASPSPWHAVKSIETQLAAFQFVKLDETAKWILQPGGRYYVIRDDSSIVIFVQGQNPLVETGFKIIGAHTDSPGLRIKPNARGQLYLEFRCSSSKEPANSMPKHNDRGCQVSRD